jgi:hypothetical protein
MFTELSSFVPGAETEAFAPLSPFSETFQPGEAEDGRAAGALPVTVGLESPFRSEYVGDAAGTVPSRESAAFQTFASSLYEAEFSEALYELAADAATALHEQHGELASEASGEAGQFLERYMAPLVTEAENQFGGLAERYAQYDIGSLSEAEVDRLFESLQPDWGHLSAASENLFGSLWKAAKNMGRAVVRGVKAGVAAVGKIVPLGWIFGKLKELIRPLLQRVIQFALNQLPAALQPAAQKLADRLFGSTQATTEAESWMNAGAEAPAAEAELLAHPDPDGIQRELNTQLTGLFFAPDQAQEEELATGYGAGSAVETDQRLAGLSQARERFAREITQLTRGQDLTEQMEQFIPAVMGALRLGISVIGRQRVVDFLAKYLGQMVVPYVGQDTAGPLSSAIVSTGMKLIGLEAPERELLAGEAVANAVEGTIRRLAEQGEQVFEDQRVLEAATSEAFMQAAAESFPPGLIREQFHEVSGRMQVKGTWVLAPRGGRRRYKKYTQEIDVTVTEQMARTVQSFGAMPLARFLRSRFNATPPVVMKAHLYEAVYGTKLSTIARAEKDMPGLGPGSRHGWRLFIPLTRQTAGILFGEPGLGRDTAAQFVISPRRITVGQRFVVLVPIGWRPTPTPAGPAGSPAGPAGQDRLRPARASELNLTLDLPANAATIFIYLNETDTQAAAASARTGESVTAILVLLRRIYVEGLRAMLSGRALRHFKMINEVAAEAEGGDPLAAIGGAILEKIAGKLAGWAGSALSDYFTRRKQEFLAAAENPADGVTIVVTIRHSSLFQAVQRALRGDAAAVGRAITTTLAQSANTDVKTFPGFRS